MAVPERRQPRLRPQSRRGQGRARRLARPGRNPPSRKVLVVAVPPYTGLVATEWCAVEPLVHTPEAVYPALVRRVGVVHNTVLERKRAQARPFAPVRRPVCPNARGERGNERIVLAALQHP